jgi:hypothetical protein
MEAQGLSRRGWCRQAGGCAVAKSRVFIGQDTVALAFFRLGPGHTSHDRRPEVIRPRGTPIHDLANDGKRPVRHRRPVLILYARLLKMLSRVDLLILDDWGLAPLTGEQRRDLLEVVDDRHQRGSTIITSQVPIEHWHEVIADPTIADAVLDRLVHNAHRLALKGDSMRKITAQRANLDATKKT